MKTAGHIFKVLGFPAATPGEESAAVLTVIGCHA